MPVDPKILETARSYIGHTGPKREYQVTRKDILRFTIAIGDQNPLYRDDDYARAAGYSGIIAPPMMHCVYSLPEDDLDKLDDAGLGPNLGPRFEVPVPGFPGAVAGGRDIEFGAPMQVDDVITGQEKVVDVFAKEGRRGPMIFVVSEHRFTNQRGETCVLERQTVIRHQ